MAANEVRSVVYQHDNGTWDWRLKVGGNVIATSGNQGYESEKRCREMIDRVISGHYKDAKPYRNPKKDS